MTTKRVLQILLSLLALPSYSQDLKVKEGEFNKVGINLEDSMAMVIFKSDVKGLTIENDAKDSIKVEDNNTVYFIDVGKEINNDGAEFCSRAFYLYCPKSSVYKLQIEDIQPKQVSFYTIVLPDNYPLSLSTEYLYTKTSKHGIRLSFGKRFGFCWLLIGVVLGSIVYRLIIAIVLQLGMKTQDMKLLSAVVVIIALSVPLLKKKLIPPKQNNAGGDE